MKSVLPMVAILLSWGLASRARAAEPVYFADAKLKAAVENELWIWDPTPADMLELTYLKAISLGIGSLAGMEYAVNLQTLYLRWNQISDITPLAGLTNIRYLDIHDNKISDLSPLAGLSELQTVVLRFNRIRDISALANLTALQHVDLRGNPLDDDAFSTYLPQIAANNPGIELYYDADSQRVLTLSSGAGGTIVQPGEGQFTYDNGQSVDLWAKADPGFVFASWSGSFTDTDNPTRISMDSDHWVHASFVLDGASGPEADPVPFSDGTLEAAIEETLGISDPTPYDMLSLTELACPSRGIGSLAGIEYASNLAQLDLSDNAISDLSPLAALTRLEFLDVRGNPLGPQSYGTYLPLIVANNPAAYVLHDPAPLHQVTIAATPGGSVTEPGQDTFTYDDGQVITLEARPDPGFAFVRWSGTFESTDNPASLEVRTDHTVEAFFALALDTIHVDGNAPSDANENGSIDHPFTTIQEGIDAAAPGAAVLVRPGRYPESIDLLGKPISVIGIAPQAADFPIVSGNGAGPVVRFVNGEDPNCAVIGLTITAGNALDTAAVFCTASSPILANCLVVGNHILDPNGAAIRCRDSQAAFVNCTIADNLAGSFLLIDSEIVLTNSIVRDTLAATGSSKPVITYCDLAGGWPDVGNIDIDPLFAQPGRWANLGDPEPQWLPGDYHLASQAGRWDPTGQLWVQDDATSPCLDAGDPTGPVGSEPLPNGEIINLGAYGGTSAASISPLIP